jgi:hypothetical protein
VCVRVCVCVCATLLDPSPASCALTVTETLQPDGRGSYYEDLYRVLVQSARDEWRSVPAILKREFAAFSARARRFPVPTIVSAQASAPHGYLTKCLKVCLCVCVRVRVCVCVCVCVRETFARSYRIDANVVVARRLIESQSNFLEAINLQLNAFDKHYIDRNFSRCAQATALLTCTRTHKHTDR